jgi:hypothetical protein
MTPRAKSLQLFIESARPKQGLERAYILLYVVFRFVYFQSRGGV